jgi:hypothetical protein
VGFEFNAEIKVRASLLLLPFSFFTHDSQEHEVCPARTLQQELRVPVSGTYQNTRAAAS